MRFTTYIAKRGHLWAFPLQGPWQLVDRSTDRAYRIHVSQIAFDPDVDLAAVMDECAQAAAVASRGSKPAVYIPALASTDPQAFGMVVAGVDGACAGVGLQDTPFTIQSISKVFSLAALLALGDNTVWKRVGREHTHAAFASPNPVQDAAGTAPNPFVNAGALVVTDRLLTLTGDASSHLRELLRNQSGNPRLDIDALVVGSEMSHLDRNRSLAHLLASYGVLDNPVDDVLHHYVRQCSIAMSCTDLARAGGFLAGGGVGRDGARLLTSGDTKRINTLMLTCGAYATSGDVAYRVGLPLKTGVSGGVIAIAPGKAAMCAWSPGLDSVGNSAGAIAALETFTTLTGYSIF